MVLDDRRDYVQNYPKRILARLPLCIQTGPQNITYDISKFFANFFFGRWCAALARLGA